MTEVVIRKISLKSRKTKTRSFFQVLVDDEKGLRVVFKDTAGKVLLSCYSNNRVVDEINNCEIGKIIGCAGNIGEIILSLDVFKTSPVKPRSVRLACKTMEDRYDFEADVFQAWLTENPY